MYRRRRHNSFAAAARKSYHESQNPLKEVYAMSSKIATTRVWFVLGVGVLFIAFTVNASAQVQTQSSTTSGASTQEVTVERGEVVAVSGNDLVVKMEDGTLRNFENVPESARATVDGREVGIHDLKP